MPQIIYILFSYLNNLCKRYIQTKMKKSIIKQKPPIQNKSIKKCYDVFFFRGKT